MHGLVVKNTGSWYTVRADDGSVWEAKVKGNFRLKGIRSTNPVAIGDWVTFVESDATASEMPAPATDIPAAETAEGGSAQTVRTALITDIDERKNYVIRRATNLSKQSHIIAANVDQCLLFVTLRQPETSTTFIDRFLASAEAYRVPVTLIFNKTDLLSEEDDLSMLNGMTYLYTSLGYPCICTSAETGEGLDEVKAALAGKVSLLSGNSGVGKSTIINRLIPGLHLRTSNISDAYNTGRHTTTYSEMFAYEGGYIIDTPGIKGFGTFDMEPEEIGHYFREIFKTSAQCRFSNCTHTHEPGCAVLEAVKRHDISQSRYQSYLSMLTDKDEDRYRPDF